LGGTVNQASEIVLIQVPFKSQEFLDVPFACLSLASYLLKQNHSCTIFDFNLSAYKEQKSLPDALADIPISKLGLYGISFYNDQVADVGRVAEFLKARDSRSLVIVGGPGVFGQEESILSEHVDSIDFLCAGEGEIVLTHVVEKIKAGDKAAIQKLPSICFVDRTANLFVRNPKEALIANLDILPFIDYSLIPLPDYWQYTPHFELPVLAGSGCPYNCTFCSTSAFWSRKYRTKSPARLVAEVDHYQKIFQAYRINFRHDDLTFSKEFIYSLVAEMLKNNLQVRWGCASRVDHLDEPLLDEMARGNCDTIFMGIETASEGMQKKIRKRLNLGKIIQTLDYAHTIGLNIHLGFIVGFPEETIDEINAQYRDSTCFY
jgi:radical SAM superfamily enzyme YgiQ (UPF0313 family)